MTAIIDTPTIVGDHSAPAPTVALKRRTIDSVLIGFGVVALAVFAVAGGLLTWGHGFSSDYVARELGSQHISFPAADALTTEGRADLAKWGGHSVDTGAEAQAYASYINGHLQKIGGGSTFAELKAPLDAATAAAKAAVDSGQPAATVTDLQAQAAKITGQRASMFQGETLRGLLLSAYAWSTVGTIAGIAAIGAFIAAGLMLVLVALGLVHQRKAVKAA
jgi:hypothetical protein